MTDPPRLLSEGASDFERELLGSWSDEQPTAAASARALALVGAGAATMIGAAAVKGGASLAPKVATLGAKALVKAVAVGAVALAVGGGAYVALRAPDPSRGISLPSAKAAAGEEKASAFARAPARRDVLRSDGDANVTRAGMAPSASAPTPRAAPVGPGALGAEVHAIDAIRQAVALGDGPGALAGLDSYATMFPHGALAEEAEALRVETLAMTGNQPGARRLAAHFLARYPDSARAARVRALLAAPAR